MDRGSAAVERKVSTRSDGGARGWGAGLVETLGRDFVGLVRSPPGSQITNRGQEFLSGNQKNHVLIYYYYYGLILLLLFCNCSPFAFLLHPPIFHLMPNLSFITVISADLHFS